MAATRTIFRADRVLDGNGGIVERGAVLVRGSRIEAVGRQADIGLPDGADVIEASGTLLPGMCDVHVHLRSPGRPGEGAAEELELARMSWAEIALRAAHLAQESLRAGFTALRDVGAPGGTIIDLRRAIDAGHVPGPRIKAAGLGLCVTGGHMDAPGWADHARLEGLTAPCDGPVGFRRGVRQQIKRGADLIKLNTFVSRHDSPDVFWRREMTDEEIAAACDEAHAQGVHVAAHVYGPEGIAASVRGGVDSIEHGHWVDAATVDLMVRHGTTYVPTLTVNDVHARAAIADPAIPERYKRWHRASSEAKWRSLEMVRKAGIRVCTGTDSGFQIENGKWGVHELELLVKGGFTPLEAITCATANGADLMGIEAGRLKPGRLADLVIVDGNPLDDVGVLADRTRLRVFKDGHEVH
ncbi:MAG: amidohydrolase family protein [Rhodobacteraceae bacterium]|jgi:imidazolonepropionase-like amidohydrolase|nr:amidohydrolase family protein [Paracoccaceae bacterium]